MSCVFCQIISGDREAYKVLQTEQLIAFLDHRPLFPGHVLLMPKEHVEDFDRLPGELIQPLFLQAKRLSKAVQASLGAEGSFVALNNKVSQSVPHLHIHVVPRNKTDGLRGFFWPRNPYRDAEHMEAIRSKIAGAL